MTSDPHDRTGEASRFDPHLLGTACGVISAIAYMAANVCLRQVALDCDPIWVSCVKAMPVAAVACTVVAWRGWHGVRSLPSLRLVVWLMLTSLAVHFAGNAAFQWALGEIGLAVTVPLTFGSLILSAALLGRIWLGEPITPRSAVAMLVLIVSIALLSFAADEVSSSLGKDRLTLVTTAALALAVGAASLAGIAYATCSVVIRRVVTRDMTLSATLMVISTTGLISLGITSVARLGVESLRETSGTDFFYMASAGVFNAVAFYSLAKSLQLISVMRVNMLNASQVAMAAVAGVLFFGEATSTMLVIGVVLTSAGLLLMEGRDKRPRPHEEGVSIHRPQPVPSDPEATVARSSAPSK